MHIWRVAIIRHRVKPLQITRLLVVGVCHAGQLLGATVDVASSGFVWHPSIHQKLVPEAMSATHFTILTPRRLVRKSSRRLLLIEYQILPLALNYLLDISFCHVFNYFLYVGAGDDRILITAEGLLKIVLVDVGYGAVICD